VREGPSLGPNVVKPAAKDFPVLDKDLATPKKIIFKNKKNKTPTGAGIMFVEASLYFYLFPETRNS
jgi:hypothetical protein